VKEERFFLREGEFANDEAWVYIWMRADTGADYEDVLHVSRRR
jgi:hypothetical protein